ncbi:MAG: nlpD [Gammaproteobacteria bacterium]|jgi:lipoprotein NlpD|nr:nlpD [Gammaproteobacteria bacterium]
MNACYRILCFCFIVLSMLSACSSHQAPIVNGWHQPISKQGVYTVRPGDGLYAIAWRYGLDYRNIVRINHLSEPYTLYTGQKLYLVQPTAKDKRMAAAAAAKPVTPKVATVKRPSQKSTAVTKPAKKAPPAASAPSSNLDWQWPAAGKVVEEFNDSAQNKGINIVNSAGTPIKAAATGQVVYSGSGLPGYGYLIIIKHNDIYLSAYAHNSAVLIKEGQKVKAGQTIARMGNTGADRVMLHFEVRRRGQPIDPETVLPKR